MDSPEVKKRKVDEGTKEAEESPGEDSDRKETSDEEIKVTDSSVCARDEKHAEECWWIEVRMGDSLPSYNYYGAESARMTARLCGSCPHRGQGSELKKLEFELNHLPFAVSFLYPNIRHEDRVQALAENRDRVTVKFELIPGGKWKEWRSGEGEIKWSYSLIVSYPERVREEEEERRKGDDDTRVMLTSDVITSSLASDEWTHVTDLQSFSYLVNADNGLIHYRYISVHLQVSVHSSSFTFPLCLRPSVLDRANELSDVVFRVDGELIYANKTILSLNSDVFHTMFNSGVGANKKVIDISDDGSVENLADRFKDLLHNIYPERHQVDHHSVEGVLALAHRYNVTSTIYECYQLLLKSRDMHEYDRCRIAEKYGYVPIFHAAIQDLSDFSIGAPTEGCELRPEVKLKMFDTLGIVAREKAEEAEKQGSGDEGRSPRSDYSY